MTKKDLIDIIKNLKISCHLPKDIACRALKGKIEKELNVAIVKEITCRFKPHLFAEKGWNFIDAAVFKVKNSPLSLIEMKAHNTIDFPGWLIKPNKSPNKNYHIVYDLNKLLATALPNTELYFIFFNNVVKSNIPLPSNPPKPAKKMYGYDGLLSKHFTLPYREKVLMVFKNWAYLLEQLKLPLNLTTVVEIVLGAGHGFPVSVIAFVYGPFTKNSPSILTSMVSNLPNTPGFKYPTFDQSEFDDIHLDGIDFYYEDDKLGEIGNGVNCIPFTK